MKKKFVGLVDKIFIRLIDRLNLNLHVSRKVRFLLCKVTEDSNKF